MKKPVEKSIERIDVTTFRVPGAAQPGIQNVTDVVGVLPYQGDSALCVQTEDEE